MIEQFLPIGVQDFAIMRQGNFVYVDKTEYIWQMIRPPQAFYFLSRPRRFGKSLTVSTLGYLFAGREDLFRGLWLHANTDWPWTKHPVIKIDFNGISHDSTANFKKGLFDHLSETSIQHGLQIDKELIPERFKELILKMAQKYQQPVVVLVDEYDKPLISHLGKGDKDLEIAKNNRDVLKQFFGVLKEQAVSAALRLVFITGVSKFSRVSIFSDLNNLRDLSMAPEYGTIMGYTEAELERFFHERIQILAQKLTIDYDTCKSRLQTWYNGYRFTEKNDPVYNPFSILNALENKNFKNYWFETGTPSFLVHLIKKNRYSPIDIEKLKLGENSFTVYDLENLKLEPLLFQTGYITIQDYDGLFYYLSYPNQEVKTSFLNYLYSELIEIPSASLKDQYQLLAVLLEKKNLNGFIETVNAILSAIPYPHIAQQDESFYHTVFYLMLSASGVLVLTEILTSHGRIDMMVEFPDKIYLIELKCNQSAARAITQIKEKKYADKYRASGRDIILVGINFDTTAREITDWQTEQIADRIV